MKVKVGIGMISFTNGILRQYEQREAMIMVSIEALVSNSVSSGIEEFRNIQERVNRIYNNEPRNAFEIEQTDRSSIQGTIFIKDHIFSDVTEQTLTLFKDLDPSIYLFSLTKAVFIFILGSKSNSKIPNFFKLETKKCIENQRKEFVHNPHKKCITNNLWGIMKDFSKFEKGAKRKDSSNTLSCFKGIAYEEMHNGLLATKCLTDALSDPKYQDSI